MSDAKRVELRQKVEQERDWEYRRARWNYRATYILSFMAILVNLAAGAVSLWKNMPPQAAGLLALVSAALLSFVKLAKVEEKSNWHYRKGDALFALANRLMYEEPGEPEPPTNQTSLLSREFSKLTIDMTKEWQGALAFADARAADPRP